MSTPLTPYLQCTERYATVTTSDLTLVLRDRSRRTLRDMTHNTHIINVGNEKKREIDGVKKIETMNNRNGRLLTPVLLLFSLVLLK